MQKLVRFVVAFAAALTPFAVVSCHHASLNAAMHVATANLPDCKEDLDLSASPVPLKQSVDDYHDKWKGKYRKCVLEVAGSQTVMSNAVQTVSGDPLCAASAKQTSLTISTYTGTGSLDSIKYGDGTGKQRGFVVAKITNTGPCATLPPFSIPSGESYYWVLDRETDVLWRAHFIRATDGEYLQGIADWTIVPCPAPHTGTATGDVSWYKADHACTDTPGPSPAALGRGTKSLDDPDFGPALWINCGGDCCYTNYFQ
jgi:hypothetical protein